MKRKFILFIILASFLSANFLMLTGCASDITRVVQTTENAVAELSIFSFDGKTESVMGLRNHGHSFLSIKNISSDDITIGYYTLEPDEIISLGIWGLTCHLGMWYNVETNYISVYNKYDGRISVTKQVDSDDLIEINNQIFSHDYWTLTKNCSHFAIVLWNSVAKEQEKIATPLIYSPTYLVSQLKTFSEYEINRSIDSDKPMGYYADSYQTFTFRGNDYE